MGAPPTIGMSAPDISPSLIIVAFSADIALPSSAGFLEHAVMAIAAAAIMSVLMTVFFIR